MIPVSPQSTCWNLSLERTTSLRTFLVQIGRADATKQRVWGRVHKDSREPQSEPLSAQLLRSCGRNWSTRDELFPGILCFRASVLEPTLLVRRATSSRAGSGSWPWPRPYLLHEALDFGLVLWEKSSVVPGFSEGSPGFEPSRALAHVACPLSP